MPAYTFEVTLIAQVEVEAETMEEAGVQVRSKLNGANCNGGLWDNGDPILFDTEVEGEIYLQEIDGEAV